MKNMKGLLSKALIFTAGAAVGSVITWKYLERKYMLYDYVTDDEYEEVEEEIYTDPLPEGGEDIIVTSPQEKPSIREYAAMLQKEGYIDYANGAEKAEEKPKFEEIEFEKPYLIDPDAYGEYEDYRTQELTYYEDGTLADAEDNVIDDVDEMVGEANLHRFGEFDDDYVHVRDDKRCVDYEIYKDPRTYFELVGRHPHQSEG